MFAPDSTAPNGRAALSARRAAGLLTGSGPASMLFARSVFAVAAQGLVAVLLAIRGSASPWRDAAAWLPLYGTLIDAACLGLLWWLARRERIGVRDLVGFDRDRLGRDVLLGNALIAPNLFFILAGNFGASLLVYGNLDAPQIFDSLPLLPALYAVIVFPLIWGITEQATYNAYVLPRFQLLAGRTWLAVAAVAFAWSFQHVVLPLTFDPAFMLYRMLSPIPASVFVTLVYLRIRRILPLATAHWLMDGGAAFASTLWPLLR